MNIYIFNNKESKIPNSDNWLEKYQYNLLYYKIDIDANLLFSNKKPDVIFSISENSSCSEFKVLYSLPLYIRKRWAHLNKLEDITPDIIERCFVGTLITRLEPVISIFTSTYKSEDKIMRPFISLQKQTFAEWEWVIIDDSPLEDKDNTWNRISALAEKDCRIRIFKQKGNDGYIGSVKHCTASMGRGLYVLELDHDDELLPTALEDVVNAFERNPEIGMVGSDCSEIYEEDFGNFTYGSYFGFGRHGYYKERHTFQSSSPICSQASKPDAKTSSQTCSETKTSSPTCSEVKTSSQASDADAKTNSQASDTDAKTNSQTCSVTKWVNVARNGPLDKYTVRHIIGVPNHLRAWRYSLYTKLRGHNFNLNVVDDFELIIRTFLESKIGWIPKFLYVQYRNRGGNNFTVIRFNLIQRLVGIIGRLYEPQIKNRLKELKLPDFGEGEVITPPPNVYLYHFPDPNAQKILDPNPKRISIIMTTYNNPELLKRAVKSVLEQDFKEWVLYIIGDRCPSLEETMEDPLMHDSRIKYWNMEIKRDEGGTYSRNYALKILASTDYIAYLDDKNFFAPSHLSSLYTAIHLRSDISFALSSFKSEEYTIICKEPKMYRVESSCLLHKRELLDKYGYWQTPSAVGYATDWKLVSKWVEGGEIWVTTRVPTLHYTSTKADMKIIYGAYDDQAS
jgi:GT2 family glycosyltransferase